MASLATCSSSPRAFRKDRWSRVELLLPLVPGCCAARNGGREEEEQQGHGEEAKTSGGAPSSSSRLHPTVTGAALLQHGSAVCVRLRW